MEMLEKDPACRFSLYETVCLPPNGDGVVEAAVIVGFTGCGCVVQKHSGAQSVQANVAKPDEAFPWAAEMRKEAKKKEEERMHSEWLLSQRAWVKNLLGKCSPSDFVNRMSLEGRLKDIEEEIEERRRNGQMA